MKAERVAACGSAASGVLASACCIVPLALALVGVSGGALAVGFEPYRPYLLVASYGLLGFAFYLSTRHPGVAPKLEAGTARNRLRQVGDPHPVLPTASLRSHACPGAQAWRGFGPGSVCAPSSRAVRGGRGLLWIAALAVVLATAFPWYARILAL